MSASVLIYTTRYCGYCLRAKQLLDSKAIAYEEIAVDGDPAARLELAERSGQRTVPQIWIGEQHIGGCNELYALEYSGRLDELLNKPG